MSKPNNIDPFNDYLSELAKTERFNRKKSVYGPIITICLTVLIIVIIGTITGWH